MNGALEKEMERHSLNQLFLARAKLQSAPSFPQ